MLLSDSPFLTSGFGLVSLNLSRIFTHLGYEVHFVGHAWTGNQVATPNFILYQAGMPKGTQFGYRTFDHYIEKRIQPDILVTVNDLQYIDYIPDKLPKDIPWIAYYPTDTHDWSEKWYNVAREVDYLVPYSQFGYDLMVEHDIVPHSMIYHGVDPSIYHYVDRNNVRKHFPRFNDDTFIIGTVATLNRRKMWNVWFEVVDKFLADKDDAYVIAVLDPRAPYGINSYPFNQTRLAKDLEFKILTPDDYNYHAGGFTPAEMNFYYNLFDCHLLTTGGEGFGLPILESMSTGITNLVTNYSACPEIVGRSGFLLPIKKYVKLMGCERPIADVNQTVDYLNILYDNRKLCRKLGERSLARSRLFSWNRTIPQWKKVLDDAM
jgi:glycosyltransferase involved in cell wall biosynthesis